MAKIGDSVALPHNFLPPRKGRQVPDGSCVPAAEKVCTACDPQKGGGRNEALSARFAPSGAGTFAPCVPPEDSESLRMRRPARLCHHRGRPHGPPACTSRFRPHSPQALRPRRVCVPSAPCLSATARVPDLASRHRRPQAAGTGDRPSPCGIGPLCPQQATKSRSVAQAAAQSDGGAARRVRLHAVMAARACSRQVHITSVHALGAEPYIPYTRTPAQSAAKDNAPRAQAYAVSCPDPAGLAHCYRCHQAATTMHRRKSCFPGCVCTRHATAQGPEALCLVRAHNLRVPNREQYRRRPVPRCSETLLCGPHLACTHPAAPARNTGP